MEQNAQSECPSAGNYNFQASSIKIVVSLSTTSEIEDDKELIKNSEKEHEEVGGFKKLIIFITSEKAFKAFSLLRHDVSTDTDAVSKFATAATSLEILEGNNNVISEPPDESHVHFCNQEKSENKSKVTIENESTSEVLVEDSGTKEKKFRGLWSWVHRSVKTPEVQRKNKKAGEVGAIASESEKRNSKKEEAHANIFEQEVNEEVPEIGIIAIDNELKDETDEQESTSVIMAKASPICSEGVQKPTIFEVSKAQDTPREEGCCSTEASNITKRLIKANNCCPEGGQEELVYRSFTGCDLAVPQDLLDEEVNSFFNEKPNEDTVDHELHQNEDETAETKLSDKNNEAFVLTRNQKSSFISRLDKAIRKSKFKKGTLKKIRPSSEENPKTESETASLKVEPTNECSTLPREDKSSTLKRDNSHDDEISFLEDFQLLFLDSSQNTNIPGYQNDVVLLSYKKRHED